ncbi:hypothetical protein TNCV_1004251 [Trichonephila clavipes]|nr:hypothetical protein TNCV_1004251 [Trichonephila clavipes]
MIRRECLMNKDSAMNKMSRCRTRKLAPRGKRREREEPRLDGGRKHERRALVGTGRKRALEKGLVRDWSGKTMSAGGVENRI